MKWFVRNLYRLFTLGLYISRLKHCRRGGQWVCTCHVCGRFRMHWQWCYMHRNRELTAGIEVTIFLWLEGIQLQFQCFQFGWIFIVAWECFFLCAGPNLQRLLHVQIHLRREWGKTHSTSYYLATGRRRKIHGWRWFTECIGHYIWRDLKFFLPQNKFSYTCAVMEQLLRR